MPAPTRRQREVLDLITRYMDTQGYRPSYNVIPRHLHLRSRAGIARIVQDLESKGLLTRHREEGHFSIEVKADETVVPIRWLNVPQAGETVEAWQSRPLSLPGFVFGDCEVDAIRAFRVPDDSMVPEISEGDVALVELREFARGGQVVAAVLDDERKVLRKYYRAGAEIELLSASGADSISFPANRVEIVGVYRGLLRPMT